MLIDEIARRARKLGEGLEVVDFTIGAKYGYVEIEGSKGKSLGLSYVPMEDITRGYAKPPEIDKLPEMVGSTNIFDRVLGVATINAISQYYMFLESPVEARWANLIDYVFKRCEGEKIGIVGNMVPLVKKMSEKFQVYVFERNPRMRFGAYPDSFEPRLLPEMDAVIVSGTTLLNDTLDSILQYASNAKLVALVGPTAGVHPSFLPERVDVVAGLRVLDSESVKEKIRLGGGRWDVTEDCEEYVIERESII